jgi:hypothetical protein
MISKYNLFRLISTRHARKKKQSVAKFLENGKSHGISEALLAHHRQFVVESTKIFRQKNIWRK